VPKKIPETVNPMTHVKREIETIEAPIAHEGVNSQLDCVLRALRYIAAETTVVNECLGNDPDASERYVRSRFAMIEGKSAEDLRRLRNDLLALAEMAQGMTAPLAIAELAAKQGIGMGVDDDDDNETFLQKKESA
jgi:CelD/BcsL family acetyltransferase involved in cellulose biosynthesis